jgi:hypothetical protein
MIQSARRFDKAFRKSSANETVMTSDLNPADQVKTDLADILWNKANGTQTNWH